MALVADYDSESETEDVEMTEDQPPAEKESVALINGKSTQEGSPLLEDPISDEEIEETFQSTDNNLTAAKNSNINGESSKSISSILASLPESKHISIRGEITPENDKLEDFIPTVKSIKETQKNKKVKITIPSMSEFNDLADEEPEAKKMKPSSKGSGLLGLLPPVKSVPLSNISFVPNTLKSKNIPQGNKTISSSAMIPHALKKKMESQKVSQAQKLLQKYDSDSDASDSEEFSKVPETYDDKLWETICARPSKPKDMVVNEPIQEQPINIAPEPPKAMDGLDNRAFKELVGKAKRPIGNINLIDINEEEILPDKDVWMTKALTDPQLAPRSVKEDDPVDPTRKRKHHITYLAQQAKAKEQELKNSWAAGRSNRMMSRSKYGF